MRVMLLLTKLCADLISDDITSSYKKLLWSDDVMKWLTKLQLRCIIGRNQFKIILLPSGLSSSYFNAWSAWRAGDASICSWVGASFKNAGFSSNSWEKKGKNVLFPSKIFCFFSDVLFLHWMWMIKKGFWFYLHFSLRYLNLNLSLSLFLKFEKCRDQITARPQNKTPSPNRRDHSTIILQSCHSIIIMVYCILCMGITVDFLPYNGRNAPTHAPKGFARAILSVQSHVPDMLSHVQIFFSF